MFLNEVSLKRCRDFVRRLQRVIDGPVPCSVVNHAASISQWVLRPHDPVRLDQLLACHCPQQLTLTQRRSAADIGWRSLRAQGTITAVNELEEGTRLGLDFGKLASVASTGARVVPVVLQDADSGEVLFIGYANEEALQTSLRERIAVLWSTSRNELWRKGATSGDALALAEVRVNCEQNSLLYLVRRTTGGACHTVSDSGSARPSCYYRVITDELTLQPVSGG